MHTLLAQMRSIISVNLGRCPRCIRQSFAAGLVLGGLALASWLAFGPGIVTLTFAAASLAAFGLWTAHIVAFAARSVAPQNREPVAAIGQPALSRRETIPAFVQALAVIALVTTLPMGKAKADDCCDCSKCSSDQNCCKTANGCCGCFPGTVQCLS